MTDAAHPPIAIEWRGEFEPAEVNTLHAAAFETRLFTVEEWDWRHQVERHSMGWVTARADNALVGFVNVITDGLVHAWIQDVMVMPNAQHQGIGVRLVHEARDRCRAAGCEWLHVDFDAPLGSFYFDACGFEPTTAGLIEL